MRACVVDKTNVEHLPTRCRVMTGLIERLQTQSVPLARRAIAEMYQNPFWQDRFGTRGRELTEQDGALHLSYLLQALAASDPSVLTSYARSLQTQLVSRGMCSRHISEHFERLERAIADLVPESDPAGELLRAARQALTYDEGLGRELQLLSDPLAEKTLDALESRQPSWFSAASSYVSMASFESILQAERARWKGDLLELISYLADALRADRLELFSAHVVYSSWFLHASPGPIGAHGRNAVRARRMFARRARVSLAPIRRRRFEQRDSTRPAGAPHCDPCARGRRSPSRQPRRCRCPCPVRSRCAPERRSTTRSSASPATLPKRQLGELPEEADHESPPTARRLRARGEARTPARTSGSPTGLQLLARLRFRAL